MFCMCAKLFLQFSNTYPFSSQNLTFCVLKAYLLQPDT